MTDPILGHTVVDDVTGFKGIATTRLDTLSGMIQYGVSPRVKDGADNELPKSVSFDAARLKVVDGPYIKPEEAKVTDINVGDNLKATITDFKGLAIEKVRHLNGCVHFYVAGTKLNKDGEPIYLQADASYWVKTGKKASVPVPEKKTGGPSRVMESIRG